MPQNKLEALVVKLMQGEGDEASPCTPRHNDYLLPCALPHLIAAMVPQSMAAGMVGGGQFQGWGAPPAAYAQQQQQTQTQQYAAQGGCMELHGVAWGGMRRVANACHMPTPS